MIILCTRPRKVKQYQQSRVVQQFCTMEERRVVGNYQESYTYQSGMCICYIMAWEWYAVYYSHLCLYVSLLFYALFIPTHNNCSHPSFIKVGCHGNKCRVKRGRSVYKREGEVTRAGAVSRCTYQVN